MPTTVTLEYQVNQTGSESVAFLVNAMSSVVLPTNQFAQYGVTLLTDNTVPFFGFPNGAARTLVFSLIPTFPFAKFSPASGVGYEQGSIVSSSDQDKPGGTGAAKIHLRAQQQQVDPNPPFGPIFVPVTADIAMNGTTPVNLPWHLKQQFPLITFPPEIIQAGSLGVNAGQINIYATRDARATPQVQLISQLNENWQGSVLSTSKEDKAGGLGLQTLEFTYMDKFGVIQLPETVVMNGQTPVNLFSTDHAIILSMNPHFLVGAQGMNLGTVTIFNGLNGTGGPMGQVQPSFFSFFPLTAPIQPATFSVFIGAFTQILSNQLQSVITALAPVVA
jgi:hypothetical protein